jgi:outer membrane PBP1 activator LpoA protein
MSRRLALLALLAFVGIPAFSVAEEAKTSAPQPPGKEKSLLEEVTGAGGPSAEAELPAGTTAPYPAPPKREPIPEGPAPHVALLLPLSSPALGGVADAVRQGFFAAAEYDGKKALPVRVIATVDEGESLLEACRKAQANGAVAVVAGLTRDGASRIARSDCPRQPTLVLNQPAELADLPAKLYWITLSLEQEARQAAQLAVNDGWHQAIVISSASPLARRVQEAFEREFAAAAGEVRGRVAYNGNPDDAAQVKERIAAMRGEFVFLALDPKAAMLARPYISALLPVYATSMSIDPRAEPTVNLDLEGVRYVDMPWFVQPDHPAVMVYAAPKSRLSTDQERLYALGIDAYRVAALLLKPEVKRPSLDGVTGRLTLEDGNTFSRALMPAEMSAGRPAPVRAAKP